MSLTAEIRKRFERSHRGQDNAIKRKDLLYALRHIKPDLDDREMREEYELLPMCGGRDGLYFPLTDVEKAKQMEVCIKKIKAYHRKYKILKRYRVNGEPVQGELPYGN